MAKSGGGVQIEKYCKDTQLIDFKRLTYTHADDSRTLVIHYVDLENMDELYDLQQDPYEMKNLIDDPAAAGDLSAANEELERLLDEAEWQEVR